MSHMDNKPWVAPKSKARQVPDDIKAPVKTVLTPGQGCAHCLSMRPAGKWLHLRTNLFSGETLCCDSSPYQHSSKHAKETGNHLVTSVEPGETWVFDYITREFVG